MLEKGKGFIFITAVIVGEDIHKTVYKYPINVHKLQQCAASCYSKSSFVSKAYSLLHINNYFNWTRLSKIRAVITNFQTALTSG